MRMRFVLWQLVACIGLMTASSSWAYFGVGNGCFFSSSDQHRKPANLSRSNRIERRLEDIEYLKLMQFNLENFLEEKPKSPDALKEIARIFREIDPDFTVTEEIQSADIGSRFDSSHLGDKYYLVLKEGNSGPTHPINIGTFIKNDLPLRVLLQSHKEERWTDPQRPHVQEKPLFSRDLPVYFMKPKDAPSHSPPLAVMIGVHNKAPISSKKDPNSVRYRGAQISRTADIVRELEERFGKDLPIFVVGDFNADVNQGRVAEGARPGPNELQPLYDLGMQNSFDVGPNPLPVSQRITQTYHVRAYTDKDGRQVARPPVNQQFDAFIVNAAAASAIVSSEIVKFLDENGNPRPYAKSYEERSKQPSDHWPVAIKVSMQAMLEGYQRRFQEWLARQ